MTFKKILAAVVLIAAVAAVPARAQVNTADVDVLVLGEDGKGLPGAAVEVTDQATGASRALTTTPDGRAYFAALPPGTYRFVVQMPGYNAITREGVTLRVGQTAKLRVPLSQELAESVDVVARAPVVDVYKMDDSTNIVPEQIQQLPVPDRDFQKLAFIAPGVQRERGGNRFIGGSAVIGASGNASQSTIVVDGADFTDTALGLARTRFSQDAIREFRVINNRFDTEIGNSAGGALSIVTKTGSNSVTGSAFAFYRADALRAQGVFETEKVDYSRFQGGFTIGGPIVKDKSHYFASLEYVDENNITLVRPLGALSSLSDDVKHPFTQYLGLLSYDQALTPNQNLAIKLVYENYAEKNFRVGGVSDESAGQELNRDNWNLAAGHTWIIGGSAVNELRFTAGNRKYDEPLNSSDPAQYFGFGQLLITGSSIYGPILGEGESYDLRDTFRWQVQQGEMKHAMKAGFSVQRVYERFRLDLFPYGAFYYAGAAAIFPFIYDFGVGSADKDTWTTMAGAFLQDDWSVRPNLTVSLGLRYDIDTNANNPDFTHPLVGDRAADDNNVQARVGFTWDTKNDGTWLVRGGVGRFTGRYLLVPALNELQQNGVTGRVLYRNVSVPAYNIWIDPANPQNTGFRLKPNITLLTDNLEAPQADQATLGTTFRLGNSGLFLDFEGVYAKGENEIVNRDTNYAGSNAFGAIRPNTSYAQINTFTNEGHSKYKAFVTSLNGTLPGGHLLTCSFTVANKKNISDDFSPALTAYPADPMNIEGEWGRARGDERYRFVLSGVFRLPWDMQFAPIFEYGSGQPWTVRTGVDNNQDGRFSDRPEGYARNDQDGPLYRSLSLRLTKGFTIGKDGRIEVIAEGFNVLNTTNYDVNSVVDVISSPQFGQYTNTLTPREIQLGARYLF